MKYIAPLCIAVSVGICKPAFADPRSDVLGRLAHCNEVSDARAWLDCYYAAAQPERAALGLVPAPQAPAYESLFSKPSQSSSMGVPAGAGGSSDGGGLFGMFTADAKVAPEQFGLANARPGAAGNVDRIVERLSSYAFRGGVFTVTLANGQVWRQTGGPQVSWHSTPMNYTVTITHGALRTYNLRVQDGPNVEDTIYKVERIH